MQIACLQNINIDIFYTINPWYSILSRWDFIHINYRQQLQERLAEKGITVRFKRKGQTDEIQGISFSKGEYTFKGSEIDRSFSFSKLDKCFGYAGMNVAESQRQTTFAPVREQAPAPGKADSPLLTGSLGLFSASSPPVDEEPNFNLRKKKKKKKRLKL